MIYQLRTYELFENTKEAFHNRFREHAARIMTSYGFDIVAMWDAKGDVGPEFVYILRWFDEKSLEEGWRSFMSDQEWSDIKKSTNNSVKPLVGKISSRIMSLATYSKDL